MKTIEIVDLKKNFGPHQVLNGINLDIEPNRIFGLIGTNGAGKTTLMKCLLGLIKPTEGTVIIDGTSIYDNYYLATRKIGFLLESAYYSYLSAYENLVVMLKLAGEKVDRKKIMDLLSFVDLTGAKDKKIHTFSFGMRQRLGLAQALINDPQLLILDEPMVGMDPIGIREFKDKIRLLVKEKKTTVLFSSHQLEAVEDLCSHIAFLKNGKIQLNQDIKRILKEKVLIEFERQLIDADITKINTLGLETSINERFLTITNPPENIFKIIRKLHLSSELYNYKSVNEGLEQLF
jgi:ABC-2 type transport system ATP-binding protein